MKAIARYRYTILALNEYLGVVTDFDNENVSVEIDQFKDEGLEVWKERDDGFLFVYCNRLEIGYWVMPTLITTINKD